MSAINFYEKQIHDAVHGPIYISRVERDVIDTKVFQRLRNIKQLGLGSLVFPSANYTRFSHSIGACEIAGRIVDAINRNAQEEVISPYDKQIYRLSALLHDIGHYPFSHLFEHTLGDLTKETSGQSIAVDADDTSDQDEPKIVFEYFDHEDVGKEIIQNDAELQKALTDHDIRHADIVDLFSPDKGKYLKAIVSSDLDCDRLDYLMRSAHNSGLPYGNVDIPYIVNNFTLDNNDRLCLNKRASSAADHLLVSRMFDYLQLSYNKTSIGFEVALKKLIKWLIVSKKLACSKSDISSGILDGKWHNFNDRSVLAELSSLKEANEIPADYEHFYRCVSERRPPVLLCELKSFGEINNRKNKEQLARQNTLLNRACDAIELNHGFVKGQVTTWKAPIKITKKGWFVSLDEDVDENEIQELVHILDGDPKKTGQSVPLITIQSTVSSHLSKRALQLSRAYFFPKNQQESDLAKTLKREIRSTDYLLDIA